ncbi:MAG: hypothetical protein L6Q37_15550, partial [Bdellovibrionaceae bacterium]|nr:hypothetical protein [Pseudobdellovibrionaceae bacterium]
QSLLKNPKASNERKDQLGNELKACYNNLTSCRNTANQVILNTNNLLNEVNSFLKQIDTKISEIENLISELQKDNLKLKVDTYFFDSELILSQFKTVLATLNSYKQITHSFIEATVINHRTLVVQSNTLPVFEEAIMLLEAKGLQIGIYRDYLHKLTAVEPIKTTSNDVKNSNLGLQILGLLKKVIKPGYETGLTRSIHELTLSPEGLIKNKITVKDALDMQKVLKDQSFSLNLDYISFRAEKYNWSNTFLIFKTKVYNLDKREWVDNEIKILIHPKISRQKNYAQHVIALNIMTRFIDPFLELLPFVDFNFNRENNPLYDLYFEQIKLELDKEIARLTELLKQKKWHQKKISLLKSEDTYLIENQIFLYQTMKPIIDNFKVDYLKMMLKSGQN